MQADPTVITLTFTALAAGIPVALKRYMTRRDEEIKQLSDKQNADHECLNDITRRLEAGDSLFTTLNQTLLEVNRGIARGEAKDRIMVKTLVNICEQIGGNGACDEIRELMRRLDWDGLNGE